MISIIDYGAGNLHSVEKAVRFAGGDPIITADRERILAADGIILPGVGSFGEAMKKLTDSGIDKIVYDACKSGKPFLGICLGMQLLFDSSEESPGVPGLSVLKGKILRIPDGGDRKIPHMGWNSLDNTKGALFEGVGNNPYVYFVHSYYLKSDDPTIVAATCDYGVTMDVSVCSGNIFATQFHPEKSGETGLLMLKNFLKLSGEVK